MQTRRDLMVDLFADIQNSVARFDEYQAYLRK